MTEFYKQIPSEAMTDFVDFYQRIANELPNSCTIAEVGVANGRSAIMLAEMLTDLGKEFTLYMIDNMDYGGPNQLNDVLNYIVKSGVGKNIRLMAMSSLDACVSFPDSHFNFVFLDSSHKFESTKAEVREWYFKIKEDGTLAGHDYSSPENPEVGFAVDWVVPKVLTRDPIPDQQEFQEEQVLYSEPTTNGHGVWYLKKKFWIKLK